MKTTSRGEASFSLKLLAAAMLVLVVIVAGGVRQAAAEDGVSVSCYIGDRSPGTVVVFDVQAAAAACNELYYDCRGRCVGCYHDFDYVDYVCIDMRGNVFLK